MADSPGAVFLDRDGVINREVDDLSSIEQLELLPGAATAIKKLNDNDIPVIIITNQPAVAKGFLTEGELQEIHSKLQRLLQKKDAHYDALYYCPHHPEKGWPGEVEELKIDCDCRKPATGLFKRAQKEYHLNLGSCFMVGDRTVDIKAGKDAGCKTILVQTGYAGEDGKYDVEPDHVCDDLAEAVDLILGETK